MLKGISITVCLCACVYVIVPLCVFACVHVILLLCSVFRPLGACAFACLVACSCCWLLCGYAYQSLALSPSFSLDTYIYIYIYIFIYVSISIPETLRKHHQDSNNFPAIRRLDELSDPEICHGWLWHLNKHRGPLLSNEDFREAVRGSLGCAGVTNPVPCARCGEMLFDSSGSHAACCAIAEST